MQAWAVIEAGAPLRTIEMPTPEPLGTEVVPAVTHCVVCHSHVHVRDGFLDVVGRVVLVS